MKFGILGTGVVGQTIGSKLIARGHHVTLGGREKANEIFSFTQGDVFKSIDDRWRAFAETGQETGDTGRRKS